MTPGRAPRAPRLGVMGGTFDPVHHGHLTVASEAAWRLDLDEVVFVPAGMPYMKARREVAPAEHRYLMTVIATAADPRFTVSRIDIDRQGPTYTVDTLRDLALARPGAELFFITGADTLNSVGSWKDSDLLFTLARFVGVSRPGHVLSLDGLDPRLPRDRVHLLQMPGMDISSTDCRERVRQGQPLWYLIPEGVVQYMTKHGLYLRSGGDPALPA